MQGQSLLCIDANKEKALIYITNKNYTNQDVIEAIKLDHLLNLEDKMEVIKQVLKGRWFSKKLDQSFTFK